MCACVSVCVCMCVYAMQCTAWSMEDRESGAAADAVDMSAVSVAPTDISGTVTSVQATLKQLNADPSLADFTREFMSCWEALSTCHSNEVTIVEKTRETVRQLNEYKETSLEVQVCARRAHKRRHCGLTLLRAPFFRRS